MLQLLALESAEKFNRFVACFCSMLEVGWQIVQQLLSQFVPELLRISERDELAVSRATCATHARKVGKNDMPRDINPGSAKFGVAPGQASLGGSKHPPNNSHGQFLGSFRRKDRNARQPDCNTTCPRRGRAQTPMGRTKLPRSARGPFSPQSLCSNLRSVAYASP